VFYENHIHKLNGENMDQYVLYRSVKCMVYNFCAWVFCKWKKL